jgi:hypothetical protein
LHFLSPIHPIIIQIESRFRSLNAEKGYPIFSVKDCAHEEIILVELTARSPTSRVMAQKLIALELKTLKEVEISILANDLSSVDGPVGLPTTAKWSKLEASLSDHAKRFAVKLKTQYEQRASIYRREQESIPATTPGYEERKAWIDDLWTIDESQAHFQILALLVSRR